MSEWLSISELFDFEKGGLQSSKCTAGKFDFITASSDWKTHITYTHDCEALVFAMGASGSLWRTHYVNGKFIASDLCFIMTPKKGRKIDLLFYYRIFNFMRGDIVKRTARGTSKLAINQKNFGAYEIPYFDFEHQIAFRDKLGGISKVKEELEAEFENQAEYLKKIRQSILQEAIEGKLTADWRAKNPVIKGDPNTDAQVLLAQIQAEKQRLIAEGKLKIDKPLAPISDAEKPFELPEGWIWVRLGALLEETFYGPRFGTDEYIADGIPTIRTTDMSNGVIQLKSPPMVSVVNVEKVELYRLRYGDILITRTGSIGEYAFFDGDYVAFPSAYLIRCRLMDIGLLEYILRLISSPHIQRHFGLNTQSGTKPNINSKVIENSLVPLPSMSEQTAIVEKVQHLLTQVDALETELKNRQDQTEQLMQAVLAEAFSPSL